MALKDWAGRAAATVATAALMAGLAGSANAAPAATSTLEHQVLLRADKIVYDSETSVVSAVGHVELDYQDRILMADSITYDQKADTVKANGHISLLAPNGDVAFADRLLLTHGMRDGVLDGFKALIGKSGRLAAARAVRQGNTIIYATRAAYTPCKICNKPGMRTPTWEIKAGRVVWDEKSHRIYYHDAVLEMFGIPVLYTPIFSHADPTVKHRSGFLVPQAGTSSAIGSFITLPLYVALSDSRDFTLSPSLTTEGGEVLQTEYRDRWNTGGMWLQPTVAYNPNGGLSGHQHQWYSSLFGSGRTPIGGIWNAGYDVQLTSNDTFLQRYNLSSQDNLVSDLFVEAVHGRSRFALTGYFFQDLRAGHVGRGQIPLVLPLFEYTYIPNRDLYGGQFRFDMSSATVMRSVGTDSERLSGDMRWRLPFVSSNGQLITFTADARADLFRVSNSDPTATDLFGRPMPLATRYIGRAQPYIGVDWRWPFIASGNIRNTSFVVEPIAQAVIAPYGGNPHGIPNEDSTDLELDETDIFSFDRIPGHTLWESGPRATVGLRSDAFFPSGSIEVMLGEAFRLKPDPIFAPGSGLAGTSSSIVGRYTIRFPPYLSLTHRIEIDSDSGHIQRNEVYFTGSYGRSNVQISYVQLAQQSVSFGGPRREVNGQATIGLLDHWAVFLAARRDLEARQMLDTEFGVGWEDDCLGLSLSYQRRFTRDRDIPPSTSILVQVDLKTGALAGQNVNLFPRHVFSSE